MDIGCYLGKALEKEQELGVLPVVCVAIWIFHPLRSSPASTSYGS